MKLNINALPIIALFFSTLIPFQLAAISQVEKAVSSGVSLKPVSHYYEDEDNYILNINSGIRFDTVKFTKYTIVPGDNFWKIAKKFDINIDTLISANPFWESLLAVTGQTIIVPSKKGALVFIEKETSLEEIAEHYEVEVEDIEIQLIANFSKYHDRFGQLPLGIALFIPGSKPSIETMTKKLAHQYTLREMFRSPLGGRFTSFFGNRRHPIFNKRKFHSGVDIAAKRGTYVGAASAGKVVSAGWMGGFGKAIIVQHKNGYKTLYGHLSRISIKRGATVKPGQLIGRVGSTGYSTGPHLHFTLWHYDKLINPMDVLW
ncbi:MAG: M23 family metallopeptidase [Spirochaetes bacterium]|jgi:murein DD-endopeptidase MepM/ murein hydrolase activator NlpD|nr:M23 family metallopeptidase [Spirochaetota bacterium]